MLIMMSSFQTPLAYLTQQALYMHAGSIKDRDSHTHTTSRVLLTKCTFPTRVSDLYLWHIFSNYGDYMFSAKLQPRSYVAAVGTELRRKLMIFF